MKGIEKLMARALWGGDGAYRSPYEDLTATANVTRLAELYERAGSYKGDCPEKTEADRAAIELHVRMVAQIRWDDDTVLAALARIDRVLGEGRRVRRREQDRKRRELRKIKREAVYGGAS